MLYTSVVQKLSISNRKGQKISVLIEGEERNGPLVFVMHGLGGWKEQLHIQTFADAFLANGFTVVRFDTTNTFGESEGKYEDATITNYYSDLEDVVFWAKSQPWYTEPFWLAGHSLGGICMALYAEKYPGKVAGLAPISTVVSGALTAQTEKHKACREEWERTGWREDVSETVPGRIKRLPWSNMVDRLKYDLLPDVRRLTMPTLLIVGELDDSTPPKHQKLLFDALLGPKEMHIIKGAKHTFIEPEHLAEIKALFDRWIKKYKKYE
ncbi:MAG: alpha/beta hydrolase [Candidatus Taylorbacteria bacterium]|nr:alpha/beta hydrolase [Candidatus Taylorbacteria bacterium]